MTFTAGTGGYCPEIEKEQLSLWRTIVDRLEYLLPTCVAPYQGSLTERHVYISRDELAK